jgi:hypothetical protein
LVLPTKEKKMNNWREMYDYLADTLGVSDETLRIVTSINGTSEDTMESILFAVTGYRSFEQILEEEGAI